MLFCGLYLRRKGGDDEAAEGAIKLVGSCAEEVGIGACDMLVGGFAVPDVTVLPIGEAFRILHLGFALFDCLRERTDGTLAALSKRSGIRVHDGVRMRTTVAGAHDDAFFTGEFATEMVKRKCGFDVCHMSNKLGSYYRKLYCRSPDISYI